MKIRLGVLRAIIRETIKHEPTVDPYVRNALAPAWADREQIGSLAEPSNAEDVEEISPHLTEPYEDSDLGPVAPDDDDDAFFVTMDPYVNDFTVLPTKN
jgi:hypothetical protein